VVAEALAPLTVGGCYLLHDRSAGRLGGNIDHLVVGPPGVLVVNAKHWSTAPAIKDGALWASGRRRNDVLQRANAEASAVSAVLEAEGVGASVTPVLVFTAAPADSPTTLQGCKIRSLSDLAKFGAAPASLSPLEVDRALAALLHAFPPVAGSMTPPGAAILDADAQRQDLAPSDELQERYSRICVSEWSKGGARRLYLRAAEGESIGFKDLISGRHWVESDFKGDPFVAALLNATHHTDLKKLRLPELYPGDPLTWTRLKHVLANHKVGLLVARRWWRAGRDRLYVHLLVHRRPATELGYVDLSTGACVPSAEGISLGPKVTASHLLTWTWMGWRSPLRS
jgi:hypothetical protein